MPFTTSHADEINNTARGFAAPGWVAWLGLYLEDPRLGGLEISAAFPDATEYARQQVSWELSAGGILVNSNTIEYPMVQFTWGVPQWGGLSDANVGGMLKRVLFIRSPLATRTLTVGRIVRIPPAFIRLQTAAVAA
jgi:hypothetical protein